uniref:Uncharacterized protein n=1 Tax=Aeromonas hydrophila TaxID=644 RepID=A0A0K0VKS5_AERHY|nr:hypothetical protein [Aeromonas hydrophila]
MKYDITTPSQYHTALVERLRANLVEGLAIESYDEWGKIEIKCPTILIQWEDGHPGQRQNDGRYNHQFMLTAHCIIPRASPTRCCRRWTWLPRWSACWSGEPCSRRLRQKQGRLMYCSSVRIRSACRRYRSTVTPAGCSV